MENFLLRSQIVDILVFVGQHQQYYIGACIAI